MKILATLFICCLSTLAFGQTRVTVLSRSATETTLRINLDQIDRTAVSTPQGEAFVVSFDRGTPLLQTGEPDLAKLAISLQIPDAGKMACEVSDADFQDYPNVLIAPSKGNLLRKVDPSTVPYTFGNRYAQDAFFPGQLADLQQAYIFRDVRGQSLWIYPLQYNPVTKTLRVYSNITLRIYQRDGKGENELVSRNTPDISPSFRQLYRKLFLNFDEQRFPESRSGETPEEMLVIAKDEFIPALEPYLNWKRQMGIHTTVVPISEIGTDPAAMYVYVKNYYAEHRITYLFLVGDENALQPLVRPGSPYSCDNCLGYMEGEDHFPEIFVGRFHAANLQELNIMMNRNLDYEKTPLVDSTLNWCATGMASTSNQGQGIGDDNQADYDQGNEWKSKHLLDGFEKYWEFYDGDQSAISPTPGDETADKAGDPVNTQLTGLMNNRGISLYNYTGHGWEQGLSSGNFNTDAVKNLRNNHRYPIVIAVACCAGNFTNNGGGDCLGEAMQRAGNPVTGEAWGGIAGFYSSDFQSWSPPMEGQDGMNQFLLDADGIALDPKLGAMATYGNALMIAAYGQGGIDMADVWNPFLDPSTVPRSALPKVLLATHETNIQIGSTSLELTCDVEGALASLYWKGQTLAVATVSAGTAQLNFPPLDNVGDLVVTVTQFNYRPYQGTVLVKPGAGAFVVNAAFSLDDAAGGNNNQKADYGETLDMHLSLSNLGDQLAAATSAKLSSTDPAVTIIDAAELFGDLDPSALVEKLAAFSFTVSDGVADGHIVLFELRIEFNGSQFYTVSLPVKIQAPKLEIGDLQINDLTGGDGDGRMESGETVLLTIKNFNTGKSKSPLALGQLNTNAAWLNVNGPIDLGALDALTGNADAVFELTVAADAPQGVLANFTYDVQAGEYPAQHVFGPYTINPILETFETQDFSSYPWQFSGNKPWFTTAEDAYAGTYASRSGEIQANETSIMNLRLDFTVDGTLSFARKVSSEQDYDYLIFSIDNVEMDRWSGLVSWAEVSYPLSAGVHDLSWRYQKDEIVSANEDRAWVDDIALPPHQVLVSTLTPGLDDFGASIFPNPSSGICSLQMNVLQAQGIEISVLDCLGHSLQQFEAPLVSGDYSRDLDLSLLRPGMYFVQIRGANGVQVIKVIKTQKAG